MVNDGCREAFEALLVQIDQQQEIHGPWRCEGCRAVLTEIPVLYRGEPLVFGIEITRCGCGWSHGERTENGILKRKRTSVASTTRRMLA